MNNVVQIRDRRKRIITPGQVVPGPGWPVRHLNAGVAGVKQLLPTPGNDRSHYVTGFVLGGGATGDGFYLLRRNCLRLTAAANTISFANHSTDHNWGTKAANGDFRCTFWYKLEATTAAVPNLITRGDEASDGWNIELTAASLVKFSFHDGMGSTITLTGATVIDDGEWHCIDCVVDRSSATGMQIYVDGLPDATAVDPTGNTQDVAGGTTVVITPVNSEVMYISTIGFYYGSTTPLTAADILADYNLGIGKKFSGSETGLQCGFNTDEGIGTSCHDVKNDAGNVGTITNEAWAPSKQNGATATVAVQGVPFEIDTVAADIDYLDAMGKFITSYESLDEGTSGLTVPQIVTFPHAIKIGRNNPLRILETDGAFDLMVFGFTEKY